MYSGELLKEKELTSLNTDVFLGFHFVFNNC